MCKNIRSHPICRLLSHLLLLDSIAYSRIQITVRRTSLSCSSQTPTVLAEKVDCWIFTASFSLLQWPYCFGEFCKLRNSFFLKCAKISKNMPFWSCSILHNCDKLQFEQCLPHLNHYSSRQTSDTTRAGLLKDLLQIFSQSQRHHSPPVPRWNRHNVHCKYETNSTLI